MCLWILVFCSSNIAWLLQTLKRLCTIWSKTHKRLKERFLIGQNSTKHANIQESPLFQATYKKTTTTEKQTINSTYLLSVGMGEAGGRKRAWGWLTVIKKRVLPKLYDAINRWCLKKRNKIEEEKEAGGNRTVNIAGKSVNKQPALG